MVPVVDDATLVTRDPASKYGLPSSVTSLPTLGSGGWTGCGGVTNTDLTGHPYLKLARSGKAAAVIGDKVRGVGRVHRYDSTFTSDSIHLVDSGINDTSRSLHFSLASYYPVEASWSSGLLSGWSDHMKVPSWHIPSSEAGA